jgi:large subunit ribosomal protein L28
MKHATGKHCAICQKGRSQRNIVSHAHNKHVRYAAANLKPVRARIAGGVASLWVCTKCIKRGRFVRAVPRRVTRPAALQSAAR